MTDPFALIASDSSWAFHPQPRLPLPAGWVRVAVVQTGLCRTDIQAMRGERAVPTGRILGHESAGYLSEVPAEMAAQAAQLGLHEGDRITLFPFLPCRTCPACVAGERLGRCWAPVALGLDADGGFAHSLAVPLSVVRRAPDALDWSTLAYVEPVTASTAVLDVPAVRANGAVAIVGEGRIATLTQAVLAAMGIEAPVLAADDGVENTYTVIIETRATETVLAQAVRALRPGGTLVIKSRPAQPSAFPHQAMVFKRLQAVGAPYGDVDQALALLASGQLKVASLLGQVFPLTVEGVNAALTLEDQSQERAGKLFLRYPGRT